MTRTRLTDRAVAIVQDTLDYITNNPKEHQQSVYANYDYDAAQEAGNVCGTKFCWAGHMVNRSDVLGIRWKRVECYGNRTEYWDEIIDRETGLKKKGYDYETAVGELLGMKIEPDPNYDGDYLIANEEDRMMIFRLTDETNSLWELWEAGNELCDGRLNVPERFRKAGSRV